MPDDSQLDPEVAALLQMAEEMAVPPVQALSVAGARARLEELFADQEGPEVGTVEEFPIGGSSVGEGRASSDHRSDGDRAGHLPVRLYEPGGDDLATDAGHPALVFYHGGGWTTGSLDTHDNVCRALCDGAGVKVLSVDYRLAPENPFPAALHDAYAAYRWVRTYGPRVNVDPDRVAVGGDSAGGNLAAAVSLYARDEGVAVPDHQSLVYPAVASPEVHDFDSYEENAEGYLLERESAAWYYDKYVADPVHRRNAYLAPLLAGDHSGLPPATVLTAGFDPLRDEGRAYADALADEGVDVTREHYPGQIHGFVSLTAHVSTAEEALDTLSGHLREAL